MEGAINSALGVQQVTKAHIGRACIAVVWFKDRSDPAYQKRVIDTVRSQGGVVSVERSPNRAHLLLVHYDRLQTQASSVVRAIRELGYDAALVGC